MDVTPDAPNETPDWDKVQRYLRLYFPHVPEEDWADVETQNHYLTRMNQLMLEEYAIWKKLANRNNYLYAVTATTTLYDPNPLLKGAKRLLDVKGVFRVSGVVELTDAGRPHIHLIVYSKDYINKATIACRFKNFTKVKKRNDSGWDVYMEKDRNNEKLLEYCTKWNIKRTFDYKI